MSGASKYTETPSRPEIIAERDRLKELNQRLSEELENATAASVGVGRELARARKERDAAEAECMAARHLATLRPGSDDHNQASRELWRLKDEHDATCPGWRGREWMDKPREGR